VFKLIRNLSGLRNVFSDVLGALDICFQDIMLRRFHYKLLSWRAGGGRKPPTVGSKGHIREDEKNYAAENRFVSANVKSRRIKFSNRPRSIGRPFDRRFGSRFGLAMRTSFT